MSDKSRGSRSSNINKNQKKKNNKVNNSDLEQTTRIRIDQERLDDSDSLDTSFLEGRLEKQFRNNKKARERLLHGSTSLKTFHFPFKQFLSIILIGIIIAFIIIYLPSMKFSSSSKDKKNLKEEEKIEKAVKEKIKVIDDNYLFIGDFHTDELDLEDVSYPNVKISDKEFELKDILDDMNNRIYQYNPSAIVIELGINDLDRGTEEEKILNYIKDIIAGIKENRPYADIYIESIYPINKDMEDFDNEFFEEDISNDDIISLNNEIKKIVKKENISYIDIFKLLSDEKQLKELYTDDGIHLNDKGYKKVLSYINTVMGIRDEDASSK